MDRGYLKLWRKSIDSEVFANKDLWYLWSWCLLKATYKKRFVPLRVGKGYTTVALLPGQFIFGRNKAAEELRESASTVFDRMKKLERIGCISIKPDNQYSIVTICNWEDYQTEEKETRQATDKQPTTNQQATDTNKKDKKEKKTNNPFASYHITDKDGNRIDPTSLKPDWFEEDDFLDILALRKKKKAAQTDRGVLSIVGEIKKARERGFTTKQCVDEMTNRSWTGFKSDWMKGKPEEVSGWI